MTKLTKWKKIFGKSEKNDLQMQNFFGKTVKNDLYNKIERYGKIEQMENFFWKK